MKKTLIKVVQSMLRAADSENVSSVGDTEEAGMCIDIANQVYFEMLSSRRWVHTRQVAKLSSSTYLNELTIPDNTMTIDPYHIYYDKAKLVWKDPDEFLSLTEGRDTSDSNVTEYNNVKVFTNRKPAFVTSFDDETIVFDAIDDSVNGLDSSISKVILFMLPASELVSDLDEFDLPDQAFSALQLRCNALAKQELKGDDGGYDRDMARYNSQMARLSRNARVIQPDPTTNKFRTARSTRKRLNTITITE